MEAFKEKFEKVKWKKCPECERPEVCESNLWKLRGLLGVGVVGVGVLGFVALPLIGFGAGGVVGGSIAASWQASIGSVTAGSLFAILQSLGATGLGSLLFGSIATSVGLLSTLAVKLDWCDAMKASLRILEIIKNCKDDGCNTKYQLRVAHIESLASSQSPEFKQGDITWNVGANKFSLESENYLSINLSGDKSCYTRMVVWLLTADDKVKKVRKMKLQTMKANENVSINQIISWSELLRPENGFIKNAFVTIEFEITDGQCLPNLNVPRLQSLFAESKDGASALSQLTDKFKFFGKEKADLKIKNIKRTCKGGCISTLQLMVTNISNFKTDLWIKFKQRETVWKIRVFQHRHCFSLEFVPDKPCQPKIVVQMQSQNQRMQPVERIIENTEIEDKFSMKGVVLWEDLLDYNQGFRQESSLVFEVQITDGIYLQDLRDIEF